MLKLLNNLLVLTLTGVNFILLLTPVYLALIPLIYSYDSMDSLLPLEQTLFVVGFVVLVLMFLAILGEMVFGFGAKRLIKYATPVTQYQEIAFLEEVFDDVRSRFDIGETDLYIVESDEINAYAIGSFFRRYVVITSGFLHHYDSNSSSPEEFISNLQGIFAHEISHLLNKDYFPGVIMTANETVVNLLDSILHFIFNGLISLFSIIPFGGIVAGLIQLIYNVSKMLIHFVYDYLLSHLYLLIDRAISRFVEYRCDRQGAMAIGGIHMARALSLLGDDAYHNILSTHPNTRSRIKKVEKLAHSDTIIKSSLFGNLSNHSTLLALVFATLFLGYMSDLPYVQEIYHDYIHDYLNVIIDTPVLQKLIQL